MPLKMRSVTDHEAVDAMLQHGGSFIKAFALAYRAADPQNQRRLREVFSDYFAQYTAIAAMAKQKDAST